MRPARIGARHRLGHCVVAVLLAGASACGGSGGQDLVATEARVRSINQLIEKGRYTDALSAVDALVQSLRIPPSGDLSDAGALALDTLVEARWRNGDTSSATLSVAERVVRWREGHRDPRTPYSLGASGRALVAARKFDDAIRSFRAALRILEERPTRNDDRAVAEVLDGLAASLIGVAQYDEARPTVERALLIKRAAGMGGSASFARTLELQSLLAIRAGRYRDARPPLDEALAIRNHQPPHPEMAMTFLQLGDLAWFEGQPNAAQKAYRECLRIAEDLLRPNHPDIAYCTTRLGLMLMDSGALSDAVASFERAVAIAEVSLPTEHPRFPDYLNNLAEAHRALMDFRRARELYERALAIQERNLGPDHQDVATYVYNLALVSRDLGDFPEAKRHFERAITIWKSRLGPDHPFVALATDSLGQLLLKQGRTDEAVSLLRDVVRMREASLGSNHRDTADALGSLASALVAAGRIREAMSLSARAISIWEGAGAPDAPAFAAALTIRADILAASGDVSGAADHYTRALSVTERILGADHPNAADLNVKLASMALRSGRNAAALAQALAAEEAGRRFLLLTLRYLPEREAVSYSAYRPTGLNLALSVVAASPRSEARAVESVVDAVVKNRALVFDEIAGRRTTSADADQAVSDSRAAWVSARQRLANLAVRAGQVETLPATNALLQEARREAERAERSLAEQSAAFRAEQRRAAIGMKEIKAALPPGSAIVSFVRYEQSTGMRSRGGPPTRPIPSYLAFVITTNAASPSVVPLGPASLIDREIEDWRRQTQASVLQSAGEAAAERQFRAVGERVKHYVWNPLERHLRSADRVFVVPDGAIHLVNLAALPVGQTEYLIDLGPVLHYLTSERDLVGRPDRSAFAFEGLLALGGAAFGALSPGGPEIAMNVGAAAGTRASCGSFESMQFSALPETLGEVEDVAHRWSSFTRAGRPSVELLTGAAASEGAFKKRAPGHRVVHLATHGFFLGGDCAPPSSGTRAVGGLQPIAGPRNDAPLSPTVSPLLQTGLALAGANQRAQAPPDADDGILTAEEVSGMNLQGTEWAVLSACDTGLGQVQAGEGVFGLRRAFQIAGAATVIMSLWSVEDQSTRSWMRALYDARLQQGANTADAVHRASASVLHDRRSQRQSTHPFYWAAFVAAGDWR